MAERSPLQHSLRIALFQLLGAFALLAVALLLNTLAGLDLPQSLSSLAIVLGAQSYAASAEIAHPGTIAARRGAIALRASALTFLIQMLLAGALFYFATREPSPEVADGITWVTANIWVVPAVAAGVFVLILGLTFLGLSMGTRIARRAPKAKA